MKQSGGAAFRRVLDFLGTEIVAGRFDEDAMGSLDAIVRTTGASRPVVREAVRVLVALGMVTAGQRVGVRVRGRQEWDLLAPQLIRWRLRSDEREAQLGELRGLRLAVEPEAARRAAANRFDADATALTEAANAMHSAVERRDRGAFVAADRRFHSVLLAASRNEMLARLSDVIHEALREVAPSDGSGWQDASQAVASHRLLARAVSRGAGERAASVMRGIVESAPAQPTAGSDLASSHPVDENVARGRL